jgi:hypothetical protein
MHVRHLVVIFFLIGCSPTNNYQSNLIEEDMAELPNASTIPNDDPILKGDFNGDKKLESANVILVKPMKGNAAAGGIAANYKISFSDTSIKPMIDLCCNIRIVNEGDLNHDGSEELSVFKSPINGNSIGVYIYTYHKGEWIQYSVPSFIPMGDDISYQELQKRIYIYNDATYINDSDFNNYEFKSVRKKLKLR